MSDRFALVIASYEYSDSGLRSLIAPSQDAEALAQPEIGHFQVRTLINQPAYQVNQAIEAFFADREHEDLLLVYSSGHGLKDEAGRLYFATPDTRLERLRTTSIPAALVSDVMQFSRSRRQVLLLDCCYSGAFAHGLVAKADRKIGTQEHFRGRGRVILTASDAVQYAFEGDSVEGHGVRSIFTRALVDGLESGEADRDHDGWVSLTELYDFLHERLADEAPEQSPGLWALDIQGEIYIAGNPRVAAAPSAPPEEPRQPVRPAAAPRPAERPGPWQRLQAGRWAPPVLSALGWLAGFVVSISIGGEIVADPVGWAGLGLIAAITTGLALSAWARADPTAPLIDGPLAFAGLVIWGIAGLLGLLVNQRFCMDRSTGRAAH